MRKINSISQASTAEEVVDIIKKQYKRDISGDTKRKLERNLSSLFKRKSIRVEPKYSEVYPDAWTLVSITSNGLIEFINSRDKRLKKSLFNNLQLAIKIK